MRNPVRTEGEAFGYVIVVAVVFLAIGGAAVLGGGDAGLALTCGVLLGGAVGAYVSGEPRSGEPAVWERTPPADEGDVSSAP